MSGLFGGRTLGGGKALSPDGPQAGSAAPAAIEEYPVERLRALLPFPAREAHKYSRGRLVLVAGSAAYPGAACLAAHAAQRMGAGYTEVVTDREVVAHVQQAHPSLVVRAEEEWIAADPVADRPGRPCAYVVGPGFDARDARTQGLARFALDRCEAPVLVDGGALEALCGRRVRKAALRRAEDDLATVLTPHAGEAARLADAAGVSADNPRDLACTLSEAYGSLVMLKGAETWIADARAGVGPRVALMGEGTPALAKAGTGDVLAGMAGALLAQGLEPFDACVLASTLHARAARAAEGELTAICVTPEDVIAHLPHAVRALALASACKGS